MLFLDTSAVLELLYGTEKGEQIKEFIKEKPISISSLNVHELLVGLKNEEKAVLNNFLTEVEVLPFDKQSAQKSAELARALKTKGKMINQMDILIAAMCLHHTCILVTCDKHFLAVDGLDVHMF